MGGITFRFSGILSMAYPMCLKQDEILHFQEISVTTAPQGNSKNCALSLVLIYLEDWRPE
ncbi:MAG: hypothetical protein M1496_06225 [Candidatus Thermoplasmatota archaeon]|nr:hypothetical protein [Candidatus Thermoplasmatota archaeon]